MIHIHVDGSFSKERGGCSSYGFLVFVDGMLADVGSSELRATSRNFETLAAEAALSFVARRYPRRTVALFTDSLSAATEINQARPAGVCAHKIEGKNLSGYLFINNIRAHTLALSVIRKHSLPPSNKTFKERFKGWLRH